METEVNVRVADGWTLTLEQDGFLRSFDMPTVLWPAGYVLSLWVAQDACAGLWGKRVLELGAGVGAPSVAAAGCGAARVLATDVSPYGRLATAGNAALNGMRVDTQPMDWHIDDDVAAAVAEGPWDLILGAGLAPDRWRSRFWHVLAALAAPETHVALAHSADLLGEPPPGFHVEEVIQADKYGCKPFDGGASEFEIVVLRLRV